jgi:hypothetical protein
MQTHTKNEKALALEKISTLYKVGLFCFLLPFILAVLLFVCSDSIGTTNAVICSVFLLISILPISIIGLVFIILGFRLSLKINNIHKKNLGYCNIIVGGIMCFIGFVSLGFIYIMIF